MKMIKFMAFLMFGGLMFASCSEDEKEDDEILPEVQELIVTPMFIEGNDTIALSNHFEASVTSVAEILVNFENGAAIRSAEYTICEMVMKNGEESSTWEAGDVIAEGALSLRNAGYAVFEEPLVFMYGKKYQLTLNITDALQKSCTFVVTFNGAYEEVEYVVDFEGEYYNALIDDAQYGGKLIYSADEYKWTDAQTSLSSEVVKADWSSWGMGYGWDHGIAISNYINPDAASYQEQLSVSKADGNFAVAYDNNSALTFADGKAHHVVSIDLAPVAYAYNSMLKACGEGYEFDVVLECTKADGNIAKVTVALAKDDYVQGGFQTYPIDLDVTSINITFDGTDKGSYGLNTPKYVAIDNIVIKN